MLRRTIPALPFHIVLLLVALFNALAGAPLHEVRHIQELVGSATTSATAGDVDAYAATRTAASDDHSEETHPPCAWCLTHALEAGLAHAPAPPTASPRRTRRRIAASRRPLHGPAGALAVWCTRSATRQPGLTRVRPQPASALQRIPFSSSPRHSPP